MYGSATTVILLLGGVVGLVVAIAFGAVTGNIAKKKGRGYGEWFVLGFFLGVMGLIIALVVEDKTKQADLASGAEELLKYKELLDRGVVSEEEFSRKKTELMNPEGLAPSLSGESAPRESAGADIPPLGVAAIALATAVGLSAVFDFFNMLAYAEGDLSFAFSLDGFSLFGYIIASLSAVLCIVGVVRRSKPLVLASLLFAVVHALLVLGCTLSNMLNRYYYDVSYAFKPITCVILLIVAVVFAIDPTILSNVRQLLKSSRL